MLSRAVCSTLHARQRIVRAATSIRPCLDLRPCFVPYSDLCHQKRGPGNGTEINGHDVTDIAGNHELKKYCELRKVVLLLTFH